MANIELKALAFGDLLNIASLATAARDEWRQRERPSCNGQRTISGFVSLDEVLWMPPNQRELRALIKSLTDEALIELAAMVWPDAGEHWPEALTLSRQNLASDGRPAVEGWLLDQDLSSVMVLMGQRDD